MTLNTQSGNCRLLEQHLYSDIFAALQAES